MLRNYETFRTKFIKENGEKITCLTAYDASIARLIDSAGVDVVLIGDSLGMVIQGGSILAQLQ